MARHLYNKIEQQQAPAFFVRGPSPFARLAFFSVLSLALMASDSRLQYLASMRQSLQTLLHPLQLLVNAPTQLYLNTAEYFSTHDTLLSENEQLKKRDLMQSIALQKLNLLALENAHMRELLAAQTALKESSVAAEIMHVGRDPFTRKILINRGQNHKILPGMAVVDAAGVIGQVTRVYPLSSEVTLVTDTSLAMPVQIERNGLRAIAFGHGRDSTVDLPYLPANVDIQRGDRLVTSGIDGVYPAGLAVATVKQIVSAADTPFARIVCEPAGGVENHRQVLVVSKPELAGISKPSLTQPVKLGLNPATPADKKQSMPKKSAKPRDAHAH
jgi:rod shape-determining protein MreC